MQNELKASPRLIKKDFNALTDLPLFTMRQEDVKEVFLFSGLNPNDAIIESAKVSPKYCWSIIDTKYNRCVAIYGLSEPQGEEKIGVPWSLYGEGINCVSKGVTAIIKKDSDRLLKEYKMFYNIVYSDNVSSIKWIELLGYTIDYEKRFTKNGVSFFYFFKNGAGG